jgi:hypothetical protein
LCNFKFIEIRVSETHALYDTVNEILPYLLDFWLLWTKFGTETVRDSILSDRGSMHISTAKPVLYVGAK